jgi:tetratricopeptide (TPR) repeat protein
VLGILEALSAAQPKDVWVQGRYSKTLITTADLLVQSGKPQEARALASRGLGIARELAGRSDATPDDMSQYAMALLTCQPADLREPATALLYARKSVAKSGGANSDHLNALAQAYFQNRQITQAIETEEKALKLLAPPQPRQPDPPAWHRIKTQLARFKAAQSRPATSSAADLSGPGADRVERSSPPGSSRR